MVCVCVCACVRVCWEKGGRFDWSAYVATSWTVRNEYREREERSNKKKEEEKEKASAQGSVAAKTMQKRLCIGLNVGCLGTLWTA